MAAPRRKPPDRRTQRWGGVARRGTRNLGAGAPPGTPTADRDRGAPPARTDDTWVDEGRVGDEPARTPRRRASRRRTVALPSGVVAELARTPSREGARLAQRLQTAAEAYQAERYGDARSILAPLVRRRPDAAALRELHGLALYRLGRWRPAIAELEANRELTDTVDQHPVLADCYRALGRHRDVERLWGEVRRGGAGVEVLTEARIVTAGSRLDRGQVAEAVALLEDGPVEVRNPKEHHLRLWYAVAAAHERAGNLPRARSFLARVLDTDAGFADAAARYRALT